MIDWDQLTDSLSDYVDALERSADETATARDRPRYVQHMATAALMFAALHRHSIADVRRLVSDERRSFGWGYLSEECGRRVESAFDGLATLVEALDDAG